MIITHLRLVRLGQDLASPNPRLGQDLASLYPSLGQDLPSLNPSHGQDLSSLNPSFGQHKASLYPSLGRQQTSKLAVKKRLISWRFLFGLIGNSGTLNKNRVNCHLVQNNGTSSDHGDPHSCIPF